VDGPGHRAHRSPRRHLGLLRQRRQHIAVADGTANLTAFRTAEPFTCKNPYGGFQAQYKVATVTTRGKFAQAYTRFEFRAQMPAVERAGVHSALWLYPEAHTYGGWPNSGEIDVAEWWGEHPANVYPSVHYAGETIPQSTGLNCPVSGASSTYHRYAVDWSPSTMRFYYDGQLCWEHAWTPNAPLTGSQPFDKPFNVVLTQLLYGVWDAVATGVPNAATLKVDWVRVWR
jgi:beta-glucanase (GH16 family)